MKLLILTQKVDINDDVLGFFHGWIEEFAKHCQSVIVICLFKGEYDLPAKVKVLSLGKEEFIRNSHHSHKIRILASYLYRFYKYIWRERNNYDTVFVHMNKEYVVLGGWVWKLLGKRVGMWHTHKQIDLKLKIAERFSDVIFTASKESFRLASKKVMVTGHGIDTEKFNIKDDEQAAKLKFRVVCVGRISRLKNQELLVKAADILVNKENFKEIEFELIGGTVTPGDVNYQEEILRLLKKYNLDNHFRLVGSVPNKDILKYYQQADLSVNLCPTGGMDKVVLESMTCGVPAIAYNKTFLSTMGDYKNKLILENQDAVELSRKIKELALLSAQEKREMGEYLRLIVIKEHNLRNLINKITVNLKVV